MAAANLDADEVLDFIDSNNNDFDIEKITDSSATDTDDTDCKQM